MFAWFCPKKSCKSNNWFIDCGYGHGRQSGSVISAGVNGIRKTADRLNKNIIIRNNVIQAVGKTAIYISDGNGVEIRDNEISGSSKAIQVKNSINVDIKNNGALTVEQ